MKYYHATVINNWESIKQEGLRPSIDGLVHLTTDKNKAIEYVALYRPRPVNVVLFRVKVGDGDVSQHCDGAMSGNHHFVHDGAISPERVRLDSVYTVN